MDQVSMTLLGVIKHDEDRLVTSDYEDAAFSALRLALYIHSGSDESIAELSELEARFRLIGCFEGTFQFLDRVTRHTFSVSHLGEICVDAGAIAVEGRTRE